MTLGNTRDDGVRTLRCPASSAKPDKFPTQHVHGDDPIGIASAK
jgi:hypothetical protein